jgi:hypothetical protein
MSAWGAPKPWLEQMKQNAPPHVEYVPALVTKVHQLQDSIKADEERFYLYMKEDVVKGKSTKFVTMSAKSSDAHNNVDRVVYFCLQDMGPSVYPHVTIKYATDGTLLNLHYSLWSGAAIWHHIGTNTMEGTNAFWSASETTRDDASYEFTRFLMNAHVTNSKALYLTQ